MWIRETPKRRGWAAGFVFIRCRERRWTRGGRSRGVERDCVIRERDEETDDDDDDDGFRDDDRLTP